MPSTLSPSTPSCAQTMPALYVVATPIGNLQDTTFRAVDTLKAVDVIACEDTRVSRKLLNHYGIRKPLISYHEHNAKITRPKLLDMLAAGQSIALISDAGTPLISDPGYKLVVEARAAGARVIPIPGASSVMASLAGAGLPTDQFAFVGFFPTQRSHMLELLSLWRSMPVTLVCFTTPGKITANLEAITEVLGECDLSLGRELTKLHEEFITCKASELLAKLRVDNTLRGEIVLAFRACETTSDTQIATDQMDALLTDLLPHMPLKAAVDVVVRHSGQPKNQVYQRALELKG